MPTRVRLDGKLVSQAPLPHPLLAFFVVVLSSMTDGFLVLRTVAQGELSITLTWRQTWFK